MLQQLKQLISLQIVPVLVKPILVTDFVTKKTIIKSAFMMEEIAAHLVLQTVTEKVLNIFLLIFLVHNVTT